MKTARRTVDSAAERERLARGWSRFLRLVERIRRQDAGEPIVRVERPS